jgi:hypothetical protein
MLVKIFLSCYYNQDRKKCNRLQKYTGNGQDRREKPAVFLCAAGNPYRAPEGKGLVNFRKK